MDGGVWDPHHHFRFFNLPIEPIVWDGQGGEGGLKTPLRMRREKVGIWNPFPPVFLYTIYPFNPDLGFISPERGRR